MQVFPLLNLVFLATVEAGNIAVSKVTVIGMIFLILLVAVVFILYKFGAKVAKNNTLLFDVSSFKTHPSEVVFDDFHSGVS